MLQHVPFPEPVVAFGERDLPGDKSKEKLYAFATY